MKNNEPTMAEYQRLYISKIANEVGDSVEKKLAPDIRTSDTIIMVPIDRSEYPKKVRYELTVYPGNKKSYIEYTDNGEIRIYKETI